MATAAPEARDAHTEMPGLEGRKAIITGGTTGIGRAIAVLLASEGVEVFVCGRNKDHLADALERIGEVGKGDGIAVDLATQAGIDRFFDAAGKKLGSYDIAVINAAVPIDQLTEESKRDMRYAVDVDFTAYILSAQRAAEDIGREGNLIFVGSMSAHSLKGENAVYAGMKKGIQGFVEALRKDLSPKGIKVGLVEPGLTGADFQYPEIPADKQAEMINQDKMLRAEDIAVAVHFMLTQPRRAVVQQISVTQLLEDE